MTSTAPTELRPGDVVAPPRRTGERCEREVELLNDSGDVRYVRCTLPDGHLDEWDAPLVHADVSWSGMVLMTWPAGDDDDEEDDDW